MLTTKDAIVRRRSIRKYKSEPVAESPPARKRLDTKDLLLD